MPAIGETWKQFELLGRGGMGEVFLARDSNLDRRVALKFFPEALREDRVARERLLHEARAAASLDHPNICKIYEVNQVEDAAFIAMEYVEGVTLQETLAAGPLRLPQLLRIASEVVEAVEAAHEKRVVHRDLKSPNIMVTPDGHVKVLDFGLALQMADGSGLESKISTFSGRLTSEGGTPGTVIYMSPEQVRGEPLDARSDIFSLGVLLYEMATGKLPFQGATSGLAYDAILNRGAISPRSLNPDVPIELENILEKALEKEKADRYQSAKEMLVDLRRLVRDSGPGAAAPRAPLSADSGDLASRRAPRGTAPRELRFVSLTGRAAKPRSGPRCDSSPSVARRGEAGRRPRGSATERAWALEPVGLPSETRLR